MNRKTKSTNHLEHEGILILEGLPKEEPHVLCKMSCHLRMLGDVHTEGHQLHIQLPFLVFLDGKL